MRNATHERHTAIDARFGSLDLESRDGYCRFLVASTIGWTALWPHWQRFSRVKLQRPVTPYLTLLEHDLEDLGIDATRLPLAASPSPRSSTGAGYVLAGSRMGMGVIRKRPTWGSANRKARRFFSDDTGPDLFRATIDWMNRTALDHRHIRCIEASSCAAFDLFSEAFDLSAGSAA